MLADSVCFCMCVHSIVHLRRGRERRGGRKGGRGCVEMEEWEGGVFFRPEIFALQKCGEQM